MPIKILLFFLPHQFSEFISIRSTSFHLWFFFLLQKKGKNLSCTHTHTDVCVTTSNTHITRTTAKKQRNKVLCNFHLITIIVHIFLKACNKWTHNKMIRLRGSMSELHCIRYVCVGICLCFRFNSIRICSSWMNDRSASLNLSSMMWANVFATFLH